ncbi:hypothetical protein ACJ41O_013024 [Fusarium nematophilum]
MAFPRLISFSILIAIASVYLTPSIRRFTTVVGIFRTPSSTKVADGDFVVIEDTTHCEDLHHHLASGLLFAACDDSDSPRFSWYPPLGLLGDPLAGQKSRGSIHVIDPKQTFTSKRLAFENFDGPFVTHGIDVISDQDNSKGIYILAINHPPHPAYHQHLSEGKPAKTFSQDVPKGRSQIEIFYHLLGTSTIKHIRSVRHPDIKTPNDVLAISPTAFYVTNDHYYTEGYLRQLEDVYFGAKWSNTVLVKVADLSATEPTTGVQVTVAVSGLHNNNGLGHGRSKDEMVIASAASGRLHVTQVGAEGGVQIVETVDLPSCIDNPSFYSDPFATEGQDSSGFVLPGLSRGVDLQNSVGDPQATEPGIVWLVKPEHRDGKGGSSTWETKLLFEDDGQRLRSATSGVLVGIDPALEGGKKKAWLFATGFYASNIIAVRVDV